MNNNAFGATGIRRCQWAWHPYGQNWDSSVPSSLVACSTRALNVGHHQRIPSPYQGVFCNRNIAGNSKALRMILRLSRIQHVSQRREVRSTAGVRVSQIAQSKPPEKKRRRLSTSRFLRMEILTDANAETGEAVNVGHGYR